MITSFFSGNITTGSLKNDWSDADCVFFEDKTISDNNTSVKTFWDWDSLYFRFEVEDNDLRAYQIEQDHPKLYLDDMVEILIDANNNKTPCWTIDDIVYHINILGMKKDDRGTLDCQSDPQWNGRALYTIQLHGTLNNSTDVDSGYVVELTIPWTELGVTPKLGMTMGINFANSDNDGNGRQLYNWCNADPIRSPHLFGTIILAQKNNARAVRIIKQN